MTNDRIIELMLLWSVVQAKPGEKFARWALFLEYQINELMGENSR